MKWIRRSLAPSAIPSFAIAILGSVLASEPPQPLPTPKDLPGKPQFHASYRHRSRGSDIVQPTELWVNQLPDGSIVALAQIPFLGTTEMIAGDKDNRPTAFRVCKVAADNQPGYAIDLQFDGANARLTRRGVRADCNSKELTVPAGACFDPNSRPDSYCAANVLLRHREPYELVLLDWEPTP